MQKWNIGMGGHALDDDHCERRGGRGEGKECYGGVPICMQRRGRASVIHGTRGIGSVRPRELWSGIPGGPKTAGGRGRGYITLPSHVIPEALENGASNGHIFERLWDEPEQMGFAWSVIHRPVWQLILHYKASQLGADQTLKSQEWCHCLVAKR